MLTRSEKENDDNNLRDQLAKRQKLNNYVIYLIETGANYTIGVHSKKGVKLPE